jgi:hypothetical protein
VRRTTGRDRLMWRGNCAPRSECSRLWWEPMRSARSDSSSLAGYPRTKISECDRLRQSQGKTDTRGRDAWASCPRHGE